MNFFKRKPKPIKLTPMSTSWLWGNIAESGKK